MERTHRLYYEDAYLTHFEGTVLACFPEGEHYNVLLDRSAFYPTSGGQPYDTGMLGGRQVVDVNVENDLVWHRIKGPLSVGERVQGCIDWPRRFDHMQQHAADHMIAGTLHRMFGGVTIGLHVGEDVSTIDVAMPEGRTRLSQEELDAVERTVNGQIQQDVPIRCWFPEKEELEALPLRKPPTVKEHVRIVAIGKEEMVACGGTHPGTAGQIGLVKILSAAPARGKMRVAFVAGMRAFAHYTRCYQAAHGAAELISSNIENLSQGVAALQEKLHQTEMALERLKKEQLLGRAPALLEEAERLAGGEKLAAAFVEADGALLRELAARLIAQPGVIALLGAKKEGQALYVFGRSSEGKTDMGALLRQAAKPFGGKGGGRPDFAQGGGSEEMLAEAIRILKDEMKG